jgi:hypothetical protein
MFNSWGLHQSNTAPHPQPATHQHNSMDLSRYQQGQLWPMAPTSHPDQAAAGAAQCTQYDYYSVSSVHHRSHLLLTDQSIRDHCTQDIMMPQDSSTPLWHPNIHLLLRPCHRIMARHGGYPRPPSIRQILMRLPPNYRHICSAASSLQHLFRMPLTTKMFIRPSLIAVVASLENVRAEQLRSVVLLPLNVVMAGAGRLMTIHPRWCSYRIIPRNF